MPERVVVHGAPREIQTQVESDLTQQGYRCIKGDVLMVCELPERPIQFPPPMLAPVAPPAPAPPRQPAPVHTQAPAPPAPVPVAPVASPVPLPAPPAPPAEPTA